MIQGPPILVINFQEKNVITFLLNPFTFIGRYMSHLLYHTKL
jgi:hypothetical protein